MGWIPKGVQVLLLPIMINNRGGKHYLNKGMTKTDLEHSDLLPLTLREDTECRDCLTERKRKSELTWSPATTEHPAVLKLLTL